MKIIQFYRNFREFTGGHLKHWHYFNHTFYAANYLPYIYFGADTVWSDRNPWRYLYTYQSAPSRPLASPDVLFVEGVSDWPLVLAHDRLNPSIPIINLIQHVRHANPDDPRYQFLHHRAIRICVSEAVRVALEETKRVNGPLITIPCGLDRTELPPALPIEQKPIEICIAALKNPELGRRLQKRFAQSDSRGNGCAVLLTERMGRSAFLNVLNQSKTAVFLPSPEEGFYLPALEGMALDTLVICPDCSGNRTFCFDGENCFRPGYQEDLIWGAIAQSLQLTTEEVQTLLKNGRETVSQYSLLAERRTFLGLLTKLDQIWTG